MDYEAFLGTVSQRAPVPRDKAEDLTRATLETLAERLSRSEADDLASELPNPMKESLISPTPQAEGFGLDEFVSRVGRRSGLAPEEARQGVRAVLSTLREGVGDGGYRHVLAQLPQEFAALV